MPATPSRIGFITRPFRIATSGPDATVEALYGNAARDTEEPLESFFDDVADAEIMADERMSLLGAQRNLVTVSIDQVGAVAELDITTALPTVRVIDDEQDRNSPAITVGLTIDMNTERSTLETWG